MVTAAATPLLLPFDPVEIPISQRLDYLRVLWRADVDPLVFVGTARRLDYAVGCHWDSIAGMPVLMPLAATLHR